MSRVAALSDHDVLTTWEDAVAEPPVGRAVALVAAAAGESRSNVAGWTIGRRDAALLDLQETMFGERIAGTASCPECAEALELELDIADVREPHGSVDAVYELLVDGTRIGFRLPTSADLLALLDEEDEARALVARCIVSGGNVSDVSDDLVARLGAVAVEHDPQAEVDLALTCPMCGHRWKVTFDIADFVWRRIDARAQQLLADVSTLAGAFGWSEREILALSPRRRALYLELIGA